MDRKRGSSTGNTAAWSAAPAMKEVPSNLVGRIVEKGFSSTSTSSSSKLAPSSLPQPTVLPFPVARHRSRGPHWAPVKCEMMNEEDDPEDVDDTDFNPVAAFANPIKRKQKKGLDFSKWRELIPEDDVPVNQQRRFNNSAITMDPKEHREISLVNSATREERKEVNSTTIMGFGERKEISPATPMTFIGNSNVNGNIMDYDSGSAAGVEQDCLPVEGSANYERTRSVDHSLERLEHREAGSLVSISDIDAENRALLQNMSPEEIAEAQAEIMGRFKPGILEMLKKRGQDKLRKRKVAASDLDAKCPSVAELDESCSSQESQGPQVNECTKASNIGVTLPSKNAYNGPDDGALPKTPCMTDSSLWNLWTSKVEKVRELRFSLDGSVVVENNSPEAPISGNLPTGNQYDVENVAERDFLRTEGDPGAAGYTIKEAVALIRSMVPGQRALALQLLAIVLDKAMYNLQLSDVKCTLMTADIFDKSVDWKAVWAFTLGPEPELVLSLRMSLDDNHISVVLASMKVIQCILCCDMNENFFNISQILTTYKREICTAPVFRSRQEIVTGFLHGGFWKYSTKPSNIHPFDNEDAEDDENDEKHTIQDDVVVAGQDVAAGLIRMGILPRLRYLLETDPVVTLEESVLTVLIGLARHSPEYATAVMKCPRLVKAAINRFSKKDEMGICPSMIRSVTLLKVLALSDKKICEDLIKHGVFQDTMWHLYKYAFSFDQWIKSGKEYCKLTSALLVEQLCFWKVCIRYGYCISYFPDFFPAICLWLSPPTIEKLIERNVLNEYASVAREAYLTLEALAAHLPYLHAETQLEKHIEISDEKSESWSWSHVLPMVDFAMNWISLKNNPCLSSVFNQHRGTGNFVIQDSSRNGLLWVISAVMRMLASILERIAPEDTDRHDTRQVPWLPEFVPKIGVEIVKNAWLDFSDVSYAEEKHFPTRGHSFFEDLCQLRQHENYKTSLASSCCLYGLIQLVDMVDKYIKMAKNDSIPQLFQEYTLSREDMIVKDGMVLQSQNELRSGLNMFMKLVSSEWHDVQSVEMFGRGGPAPGVGLGWGASGGGFWSWNILQAQMDVHLVVGLLEIYRMNIDEVIPAAEETTFVLQRINCALGACLVAGPRDKEIVGKALDILLQQHVLKFLDVCIRHSLLPYLMIESFRWEYEEEDYLRFSRTLNSHLRKRWLNTKQKSSDKRNTEAADNKSYCGPKKIKHGDALDTIPEDRDPLQSTNLDVNYTSLVTEWAHQRLPLPMHWFLSPIATMVDDKAAGGYPIPATSLDLTCSSNEVFDTVKSGLFFLLGLEATAFTFSANVVSSPIQNVPLVWKLHALSMALLVKMDLLGERRSRETYRTLQELYGKLLDQSRQQGKYNYSLLATGSKCRTELLKFKADVHESYTTFIETLVEQFAAISYGDEIYGRQVAVYLHQSVETPVRLATWNFLSTAHVLELLPPLGECLAEAEGYLQPVEDNEGILEAYMKSWVSGGLDKAAVRGSLSFTLALHHLGSFIFLTTNDDRLSLKKKLLRSLLRDHSRKQQHQGMVLRFIHYKIPDSQEMEYKEDSSLRSSEIKRRLDLLSQACEGNSSLFLEVEKLKSSM